MFEALNVFLCLVLDLILLRTIYVNFFEVDICILSTFEETISTLIPPLTKGERSKR